MANSVKPDHMPLSGSSVQLLRVNAILFDGDLIVVQYKTFDRDLLVVRDDIL